MDLGSMRYQNRSQNRGSLSSHKVPLFYRGLAKLLFSSLQTLERKMSFVILAAAAAKSLQSCPTLCDPIDGSPPGSPVPGILQARTLEWVAISFSNA